jgi:hypothetical protein
MTDIDGNDRIKLSRRVILEDEVGAGSEDVLNGDPLNRGGHPGGGRDNRGRQSTDGLTPPAMKILPSLEARNCRMIRLTLNGFAAGHQCPAYIFEGVTAMPHHSHRAVNKMRWRPYPRRLRDDPGTPR